MDYSEASNIFNNVLGDFLEKGREHAKLKAEVDFLSEEKKNLLADLMMEFKGPMTTREMNARHDDRYRVFCQNLKKVKHAFYVLETEMNVLDKKYESYRTLSALARAEMSLAT